MLEPVEAMLKRFDAHLRDERGLREGTRDRYLRDLRIMLAARCGDGSVDVSLWTAQSVRECVAARAATSLHAVRSSRRLA